MAFFIKICYTVNDYIQRGEHMKKMVFMAVLFAGCIFSTVFANAQTVKVGLEKYFKNSQSVSINDNLIKISVGNGEKNAIGLGKSYVIKPISKNYYSIGKYYKTYNLAEKQLTQYIGNSCIPVLTDKGWTIYITTDSKISKNGMTKIATGSNAVVLSVNGYNKFIVDGSASARVSTDNGIVDLTKSKYRGEIAMYVNNSTITPIDFLDIDQYLYGVVPSEMPSGWSIEALKAQAVAARTYVVSAVNKNGEGKHGVYDICDTVHCQAYNGINSESQSAITAVQATAGKCIYNNGSLIEALYFSSDGGATLSSEDVWSTPLSYLVGKKDIYETDCKKWERVFTYTDLTNIAYKKGYGVGNVTDLVAGYNDNGIVNSLTFKGSSGSKTVTKEEIRTAFNASADGSLSSRNFTITVGSDGVTITGKGYGHSCGMSQYGAKAMAEAGKNYIDILKFYYTGVEIK